MNARPAPVSRGIDWLSQALRLLGRRPLSLVASMGAGFFMLLALALTPTFGPVLATFAVPAVSLGMLAACRAADAGTVPGIVQYFDMFRPGPALGRLIALGVANAAVMVPLSLLIEALGVSLGLQAATHGAVASDPAAPSPVHPGLLAIRFVLTLPMLMAMLLAPALVAWRDMTAGKAMFFSFFACWRYRWALLALFGSVVGLGCLSVLILSALISLATADPRYAMFAVAPISLGMLALLQCGTYRMYLEVFDAPGASA
jgi:hypothetical protein